MLLTNAQKEIVKSKHRFRVLLAGRRFGKTVLAVEEMVFKALTTNDARVVYIAPTFQSARDIAFEILRKRVKEIGGTINETRLEIEVPNKFGGKSKIFLRSWDSIETLRGQYFDFMVLDEVAQYKDFWSNWQEVLRPTLTDKKGRVLFISTPVGFNHFYDLYNSYLKDKDFISFKFTSYDNPHIPKEEIDTAKNQMTPERFAQEYMAEFSKTEGLVYKEFKRDRHLYTELPNGNYEKIAGIDFGYVHPAVVLDIRTTGEYFYVEDEWVKTGKTEIQVAEYVSACGFNSVYPDPESPSAIEELRRKGINIREVIKNRDSVKSGIQRVRELFIAGKLKINTRCINLISELETYSYKEDDDENPIKEGDDACFTKDALIELPIGNIICYKSTGIKDVYEFMGSKVTANHPYLTQRGFVRLDALRYSDRIVIWKNKLLMELSLDGTQNQIGMHLTTIFHLLHRNVLAIKQNAYIDIYGKNIMEKCLKVCISIITMATRLTMSYLISNLYHLKNILFYTMPNQCQNGGKISRSPVLMLSNGINQGIAGNFILESVNYLGRIRNTIKEIAINVVKDIQLPFRQEVNSATIIAKLKHCGKEEVFGTATTSGFFTVNGIVVSNCDALRYPLMMRINTPKFNMSSFGNKAVFK